MVPTSVSPRRSRQTSLSAGICADVRAGGRADLDAELTALSPGMPVPRRRSPPGTLPGRCRRRAGRRPVESVRGNVDARLAAMEAGVVDGLIVSLCVLDRLEQRWQVAEVLGIERMCPPLGAAVVGLQCRADDARTLGHLAPLDERTRREITAERIVLRVLRGNCEAPVAGHCTTRPDGRLSLRGTVFAADGSRFLHSHQRAPTPPHPAPRSATSCSAAAQPRPRTRPVEQRLLTCASSAPIRPL
ncbi:hypothetical protein [Streptomyces roseoverticillatus]|uniref:hydroxymethylbilane synthase n=1 Tax=Streptomyces roseoverticillatus TaxID=66429 RepID=A0ABV3J338_9ACTN